MRNAVFALIVLAAACQPAATIDPPGDTPSVSAGDRWLSIAPCNFTEGSPADVIAIAWFPETATGRWYKFRLSYANYGDHAIWLFSRQLYYTPNVWPGTACWDSTPPDWSEQWVTGNSVYTPSDFYMVYNMYAPALSSGSDASGPWVRVQARFGDSSFPSHQWITRDAYSWTREW